MTVGTLNMYMARKYIVILIVLRLKASTDSH
jgi:hypothetical protein